MEDITHSGEVLDGRFQFQDRIGRVPVLLSGHPHVLFIGRDAVRSCADQDRSLSPVVGWMKLLVSGW